MHHQKPETRKEKKKNNDDDDDEQVDDQGRKLHSEASASDDYDSDEDYEPHVRPKPCKRSRVQKVAKSSTPGKKTRKEATPSVPKPTLHESFEEKIRAAREKDQTRCMIGKRISELPDHVVEALSPTLVRRALHALFQRPSKLVGNVDFLRPDDVTTVGKLLEAHHTGTSFLVSRPAFIQQIPASVLSHLFTFDTMAHALGSCYRVCQTWRKVVKLPTSCCVVTAVDHLPEGLLTLAPLWFSRMHTVRLLFPAPRPFKAFLKQCIDSGARLRHLESDGTSRSLVCAYPEALLHVETFQFREAATRVPRAGAWNQLQTSSRLQVLTLAFTYNMVLPPLPLALTSLNLFPSYFRDASDEVVDLTAHTNLQHLRSIYYHWSSLLALTRLTCLGCCYPQDDSHLIRALEALPIVRLELYGIPESYPFHQIPDHRWRQLQHLDLRTDTSSFDDNDHWSTMFEAFRSMDNSALTCLGIPRSMPVHSIVPFVSMFPNLRRVLRVGPPGRGYYTWMTCPFPRGVVARARKKAPPAGEDRPCYLLRLGGKRWDLFPVASPTPPCTSFTRTWTTPPASTAEGERPSATISTSTPAILDDPDQNVWTVLAIWNGGTGSELNAVEDAKWFHKNNICLTFSSWDASLDLVDVLPTSVSPWPFATTKHAHPQAIYHAFRLQQARKFPRRRYQPRHHGCH